MEQTKGQIRALDILARTEAGEPRADIAKSYNVSESSIYFETRFGRFTRYRAAHPDAKKNIGSWGSFDILWGKTDKTQKSEDARFAQLIDALPMATDPPAAKPPRKDARKAKPALIIEAKASPEPTPEPEAEAPIAAPALDQAAARREKKTIAQRLRRAAAKA